MKDIQGYLIIGISIIISAVILVLYFPDPKASANHCYKKVYQHEVGSSKSLGTMANAAIWAKEECLDK